MKASRKTFVIIGLALLAFSALVSSAAAVTAYAYQNRVSPRTIVAGLAVGSLTHLDAAQLVIKKEQELAQAALPITYLDQTQSIPLTELGVTLAGPDQEVITPATSLFDWASPAYWQRFFTRKTIGLRYNFDAGMAQRKIEQAFNVTTTAKDAALIIQNNELAVQESSRGESLGITRVATALNELLTTGQSSPVTVAVETVEPIIDTLAANQTKTEIEASLRPVYLLADNRSFTIAKSDLYELISYDVTNNQLSWRLDDQKLQAFLSTKIADRINVKMVQKLIQSDTQEVTQQGRDGKAVDTATLVSAVKRTITEQTETRGQPLVIPVKTVAFTEKIVPPEYIAGLFEGLYVDINLSKQKLFIITGQTKTAQYLISSGKRGTPTPVGLFYIKNKIDIAQSRLYPGIWMRNWNALARNPDGSGYEGYGIHDLPAFNAAYTIIEGASHLGRPVSHGCVRLGHDASVWFYQNVPVGTPVNIHY